MFQKYMEKDSHSASHPTCGICMLFFWISPSWLVDSIKPYVTVRNTTPKSTRQYCIIRHHTSCVEGVACAIGGPGGNWTRATRIFSPLLYLLSYRPIYKTQIEKIEGLEPTTDCLTDNCSTKWAKFFQKEKLLCASLWLHPWDSNPVSWLWAKWAAIAPPVLYKMGSCLESYPGLCERKWKQI